MSKQHLGRMDAILLKAGFIGLDQTHLADSGGCLLQMNFLGT